MKVLVVDDYTDTTDMLAEIAGSMGHAVTRAYTGTEALKAAAGEGAFELILLDIGLPDINGHALCMRLRASEKYASRRIFSLTAHDDIHEHFDMSCFDGHLSKPLSVAAIESLLSGKKAEEPVR
ncbi:response regulator [Caballeronia sp. LP006]|jgi:CheY-like chemotaxis protein|nr:MULTISPECIES: response regulator [unclassified Caballeronia]MDR5773423.1 response regulator [Caballeronia sp. LZ002]MDR5806200.1 response regulator [Caballeronia sp. LZ001]MDR5826649.1 response regulator [Caballeronia sp. LP006]MDR5848857.1 response regulator [Caballeronia sp. LZ003]